MVFSHGWPLSADAWEDQMVFLGARGYRCITHDRRGHGLSSQPWNGNDMDTYADDLATAFGKLDILINNAGIYEVAPIENVTPEHVHKQFNPNVLGLLLAIQEAIKHFGPNQG